MRVGSLLHSSSLRFAVALWAGSVLALYAAFFLQLEPAQWAGITVWIMFIQTPRLNYSKLIYWSFGTVGGSLFAIALISCCNQNRVLFLGGLTLWLSGCAYAANLVKSYNAYGAVLAGYTATIVSLSAIDHPEQVFDLAVNRVSCIFIGMAAAVIAMLVILPRHPHWKESVRHLDELSRDVFSHISTALGLHRKEHANDSSWTRVIDRLSLLEHTLDPTTAETADSRLRAAPARRMMASLFCVLAKSQSIEGCLLRRGTSISGPAQELLAETRTILSSLANCLPDHASETLRHLEQLQARAREAISNTPPDDSVMSFMLLRLGEVLQETENVLEARAGISAPQNRVPPSRLDVHRDHAVARSAFFRMALAMTCVGIVWVVTGWPSGAQFVLFTGVVCSLLSLQEDPRAMGWGFIKSASICAAVAFIDLFWILQKGEGFLVLACALALFLIPAAYFYRNSILIGSAVPSMLLFYGLVSPSNQMTYDIGVFLNSALGFLFATGAAFFAFHAILPPAHPVRCANLLKDIWRDIEEMGGSFGSLREQGWASLVCDRIRLLHRFGTEGNRIPQEQKARLGLQLGLRRMRLESLASANCSEIVAALTPILKITRRLSSSPESVIQAISRGYRRLQKQNIPQNESIRREALAELGEMESLLRSREA